MKKRKRQFRGSLDRVTAEVVSGWCTAPRVVIALNGIPFATLFCNVERRDVKAAGASSHSDVGFQTKVELTSKDIVSVATECGEPLGHSPRQYLAEGDDPWLDLSALFRNRQYSEIADLRSAVNFDFFRPLFGHAGRVVAAVLASEDKSQSVVARLGVSQADARRLTRLHRHILEPSGVACPTLRDVQFFHEQYVLLFDYFEGMTLDRCGVDWEQWLPAIKAELERLRRFGGTLNRRRVGGGKQSSLWRLIRHSVSDIPTMRIPSVERRFLSWLITKLMLLPRVLSHGDLHRENVLVNLERGELTLIDWDRAGYLPVGYDLALLMRGLRGQVVERFVMGDARQMLGVLGFTYLFQRIDRKDFQGSDDQEALRQHCLVLAKRSPVNSPEQQKH